MDIIEKLRKELDEQIENGANPSDLMELSHKLNDEIIKYYKKDLW